MTWHLAFTILTYVGAVALLITVVTAIMYIAMDPKQEK